MSIPRTKEMIAAYAVDRSQTAYDLLLDKIGEEALITFASNHTRLLTAAKAYLEPQSNDAQSERVHAELVAAIEEADRLNAFYHHR